jgi:flagellar hook protein FlgE
MMRSMFAGVSGLRNHQIRMDVIGNNIANVNTTGFKAGRVTFQDMLSQTLKGGTAPASGGAGGINPAQIGLGMIIGAIDTLHTQGNLGTTGKSTDMALQGDGFFVMSDGEKLRFSRDGTFDIGQDSSLVNPASGYRVQGWMANNSIVDTTAPVQNVIIPIGAELVAKQTSVINMVGNFDAAGAISTSGTEAHSGTLYSAAATPAAAGTLLTALTDSAGVSLGLNAGSVITVNAKKNAISQEPFTYTVTAGSTVNDLRSAMQQGLGIVNNTYTSMQLDSEGRAPGVYFDAVSGQLEVSANYGNSNDFSDIYVTAKNSSNTPLASFASTICPDAGNGFTETVAASGEGLMSTMVAYDSLGVPHTVNVYATKVANNQWTWNADCVDSTNGRNVGSGTINFTGEGAYYDDTGTFSIPIDTGATTPLTLDYDFRSLTQFSKDSTMSVRDQDGFAPGTLEKFSVGADGIITGIYTNGMTDTLGQVAVANFANPGGLLKEGNNLYAESTNSGVRQIGVAGTGGRGYINNGVLELSNVDLPQTFTDMIITERGFQANARIITTSDNMLQELVNLKR